MIKRIAFDLDGTIYNSLDVNIRSCNELLLQYGYFGISNECFTYFFQTKDWAKFWSDIGVKECDVADFTNLFHKKLGRYEPRTLIPGALDVLAAVNRQLGASNIFFITNLPEEYIKMRFANDKLEDYLSQVRTNDEGKAEALFEIAGKIPDSDFVYIGDLISDGEECLEARRRGALNIQFLAVAHKYAMNHPSLLIDFCRKNPEFARATKSLDELMRVIK